MAAILVCDLLWLALCLSLKRIPNQPDGYLWLASYLASLFMFAVDLWTLGWVGMWMGVSIKSASHAVFASMTRILILPWIIFAIMSLLLVFLMPFIGFFQPSPGLFFVTAWVVAGLGVDLAYGRRAYLSLHRDLRTVATQRFSAERAASK